MKIKLRNGKKICEETSEIYLINLIRVMWKYPPQRHYYITECGFVNKSLGLEYKQ